MSSFASHYRETVTSRGLKYRYYYTAPQADSSKPFLVFIHGFPSLSYDWRRQVAYFEAKGYGIIAPDMLGYGGTDKPTDAKSYIHSLLAKDIVDILDAENVVNLFVIGHDWGSKTTSTLANRYQDRFAGFGFLALGYVPPNTTVTFDKYAEQAKAALGYDGLGYWSFFSAEGADKILQQHVASTIDLIYSKDLTLWKERGAPTGALQAWVESNTRTPRGDFISEEDGKIIEEYFSKNGFSGPVNYYKVFTSNLDIEDNKDIPTENYVIKKPVFFGGDTCDLPAMQQAQTAQFSTDLTAKIFECGHWVQLQAADELNAALEEWLIAKS